MILTTTSMQRDHTPGNIADKLKAATDKWGITQKIVTVVTDICQYCHSYNEPDTTRCTTG